MTPDYHEETRTALDGTVHIVLICDLCGQERRPGDWPDCRKDGSHSSGRGYDTPLEPYFDWQLGEEITTRVQRTRIADKAGMEVVDPSKPDALWDRASRKRKIPSGRVFIDMGGR